MKEAAFEAACDGLVAFGPQIAHNVGFERLITTPTQGKTVQNQSVCSLIYTRFDTGDARIFGRVYFQARNRRFASSWKSAPYD